MMSEMEPEKMKIPGEAVELFRATSMARSVIAVSLRVCRGLLCRP